MDIFVLCICKLVVLLPFIIEAHKLFGKSLLCRLSFIYIPPAGLRVVEIARAMLSDKLCHYIEIDNEIDILKYARSSLTEFWQSIPPVRYLRCVHVRVQEPTNLIRLLLEYIHEMSLHRIASLSPRPLKEQ